jgi:hypothetical protein
MQVFDGDDGKSTSSGCFFVLVILNLSLRICLILPHMLGLDIVHFPHSMSLLFFCLIFFNKKIKIRNWGRRCIIVFPFDSFSDIICIFT